MKNGRESKDSLQNLKKKWRNLWMSAAILLALSTASCSEWKQSKQSESQQYNTEQVVSNNKSSRKRMYDMTKDSVSIHREIDSMINQWDSLWKQAKSVVSEYKNLYYKWSKTSPWVQDLKNMENSLDKIWNFSENIWFEINENLIKSDEKWSYATINWYKFYTDGGVNALDNDSTDWNYFQEEWFIVVSNNWKTVKECYFGSWLWDSWGYYITVQNKENGLVYNETSSHDQQFVLRNNISTWERIIKDWKDYMLWKYEFPRLFSFEWESYMNSSETTFEWIWIFKMKNWTVLKWKFKFDEDLDYWDIIISWKWEIVYPNGTKETWERKDITDKVVK